MRKLILTLAISTSTFVSISNAQGPYIGSMPDPGAQTDKMAADLGLNSDQKAKVLAINTDAADKVKALKANQADRSAGKEVRKQIEQERDTALKAVLTDDQYKKYTQLRDDAKRQRMRKSGEMAPNDPRW
jgi:hypothetical protein